MFILITQYLLLLVYEFNRCGILLENDKIRLFLAQLEKLLLCDLSFFFFSSRRRHTRCLSDWSSDVCSSDLSRRSAAEVPEAPGGHGGARSREDESDVARHLQRGPRQTGPAALERLADSRRREIGRASCRERGSMAGAGRHRTQQHRCSRVVR